MIDDGKVLLKTLECDGKSALLEVINGTALSNRKGVSLPDTDLPMSAMTDKDTADLHAALEQKVDWIALSFVQRPDDLVAVRKIVRGSRWCIVENRKTPSCSKNSTRSFNCPMQ